MPEPSQPSGDDPDMEEELTLSQAAKEFRISHGTLGVWVWSGKIASRIDHDELNHPYRKVKRGAIIEFLAKRPNRGRPLKPNKPNA